MTTTNTPTFEEVCEQLLTASQTPGTFGQTLAKLHCNQKEKIVIVDALVALHQQNKIDVLKLALGVQKTQTSFWIVVDPLLGAATRLAKSIDEMLQCLLHFRKEMGNDGYVVRVFGCARDFCNRDEALSVEFIDACAARATELAEFLPPALVGLSKLNVTKAYEKATNLCHASDIALQSAGSFALGLLDYGSRSDLIDTAITEMESLSDTQNPSIQISIVRTTGTLLSIRKDPRWESIIVRLSASNLSATKLWVATVMTERVASYQEEWFRESLRNLESVEIDQAVAHGPLDDLLVKLIAISPDTALVFLDGWVKRMKTGRSSFGLKGLLYYLMSNQAQFERFITHWFSADHEAQHWLASEFVSQYGLRISQGTSVAVLSFDQSILNALPVELIEFMVRKVIGHCFVYPKLLCSLLFSVLKRGPEEKQIEGLVIRYLVSIVGYNYFGTLDAFLKEKTKTATKREKRVILAILSGLRGYTETLQALPRLKEYSPSSLRMQKYSQAQSKQMAESMKKTEDEGDFIFTKLAKKMPMKCGRSFFFKQTIGPKATDVRLVDPTPLKEFSVQWEAPRHASIDPVGCEYELYKMRVERRKDFKQK